MSITVQPGKKASFKFPLNQTDAISVTVDWSNWLGNDTISSVLWTPEDGLTVSSESNNTTTATALVTAAANASGRIAVQQQITTAAGQKRSVLLEAQIVDLS